MIVAIAATLAEKIPAKPTIASAIAAKAPMASTAEPPATHLRRVSRNGLWTVSDVMFILPTFPNKLLTLNKNLTKEPSFSTRKRHFPRRTQPTLTRGKSSSALKVAGNEVLAQSPASNPRAHEKII